MPNNKKWSAARLASAVLLGAGLSASYAFLINPTSLLYRSYLCWRHAVSSVNCLSSAPYDFVRDIEGVRYEGNTGDLIDINVLYFGAFEKNVLFFLRDAMRSIYSNRGVFVDIGANTGQHSLYMSRYASEVHAFEPWEPVLKRFRHMVAVNGRRNIVIHPVGLGHERSKKPFYKPGDGNLGTGSFVEGFTPANSYEGELEIQTGDEALAAAGVKSVALIKMDIEGYEKFALMGLRRTLLRDRPIVEFELTANPNSPVSIKGAQELAGLFPENYNFLIFSEGTNRMTGAYVLKPIEAAVRFDALAQYDLVAYPTEIAGRFPFKSTRR